MTPGWIEYHREMIALRAAPIFSSLPHEGLAELARASREDYFHRGANLCVEGEPGNEVFILLPARSRSWREMAMTRKLSAEQAGGFIGELAVLDRHPFCQTLCRTIGARVTSSDGEPSARVNAEGSIATHGIRVLAQACGSQRNRDPYYETVAQS